MVISEDRTLLASDIRVLAMGGSPTTPNVTGVLRRSNNAERLTKLTRLGLIEEVPARKKYAAEIVFKTTKEGEAVLKDFIDHKNAALAKGIEKVRSVTLRGVEQSYLVVPG